MKRNNYGELLLTSDCIETEKEAYKNALQIIKKNVENETLPKCYDNIEFDRKRRASGLALHHEIYDFNETEVLLCVRRTSGNKYGVSTDSKDYYIVTAEGVSDISKNVAAKYAKAATKLGDAIEMLKAKGF